MARKKNYQQNKRSTIKKSRDGNRITVSTLGRDPGTLEAEAFVRQRTDTKSSQSLSGLSLKLANGLQVNLTGPETRTLYRVLRKAARGRPDILGYAE